VEKGLAFIAVFILGAIAGAVVVLTAHNCCCEDCKAPACCPAPACHCPCPTDTTPRLEKLERHVFKTGSAAE
jgi:hypothetical protein